MKLNTAEQCLITNAVERAEAITSAEIAWKVVDRSSSYSDASWIWGFIMILVGLVLQIAIATKNGWSDSGVISLVDVAISFIVGILMAKIPICRRFVTSNKRMKRRVMERACASFFTGGVHLTTQHNGVLIYVSIFEKMAVLIPDKNADVKQFPANSYFTIVNSVWANKKLFIEEITDYIEALGNYLAPQFPPKAGDVDEVQNGNLQDQK